MNLPAPGQDRFVTRIPIAALLGLAAGAVLVDARQVAKFRSGTHMVSVYTTVVDESGRLVPNLTRDDFEIFDNGVRQDLSVFENGFQPITVAIMLDRSGSMTRNFTLVREAAEVLVGKLAESDRARIGTFSNRVQLDPPQFTSDKAELLRILRGDLQEAGPTPLWNATAVAMTALAHQDGRRVVLIFTDGEDSPFNPEMATSFSEVRTRAQVEEIMIYGVGLSGGCEPAPAAFQPEPGAARFQRGGPGRGGGGGGSGRAGPRRPGGRIIPGRPGGLFPGRPGGLGPGGIGGLGGGRVGGPPPGDRIRGRTERGGSSNGCVTTTPDPDLKALATDGGGGYFELRPADDLGGTFARVADELHQQYLLAFPPSALDGRLHRIEVRLRQSNLTARARKSYLAPLVK
jgi:VWFA-related protein